MLLCTPDSEGCSKELLPDSPVQYTPVQKCSHSVLKAACRYRRYNTKDEENNESVPAVLNLSERLP